MEFRVLAVGDVVGKPGLTYLGKRLRKLRRQVGADLCVVNGENAAMNGMTPDQGEAILDAGADVVTLGNHTWRQREIVDYLDETSRVLRPANFAPQLPGQGVGIYDISCGPVAVVSLIGRLHLDSNADNPFYKIDGILRAHPGMPLLVDFHAEASSEKLAMGFYLDGRAAAVWGDPHPRAHRRRAGTPPGDRLYHRPGHDRSSGVGAGHPAGAVHRPVSRRADQPLCPGARPLLALRRGIHPGI